MRVPLLTFSIERHSFKWLLLRLLNYAPQLLLETSSSLQCLACRWVADGSCSHVPQVLLPNPFSGLCTRLVHEIHTSVCGRFFRDFLSASIANTKAGIVHLSWGHEFFLFVCFGFFLRTRFASQATSGGLVALTRTCCSFPFWSIGCQLGLYAPPSRNWKGPPGK